MKPWQTIAGVLTAITLLAGAVAAVEPLRFWAWAGEFEEIAAVSLTTAINQRYDILALERRELRLCQKQQDNCINIERRIQRLEQEIRELEKKRKRYGG